MTENSDIFANITPRDVPFFWKGKEHTFKVIDTTWAQKNTVLSKCMTVDKSGKPSIDVARYNDEMLMIVLKDTGGLFEINKLEFKRFSDEFGEALDRQIIPNPYEKHGMSDEDEKN